MYVRQNGRVVKVDNQNQIRENYKDSKPDDKKDADKKKLWMYIGGGIVAVLVLILIIWLVMRQRRPTSAFGYRFF